MAWAKNVYCFIIAVMGEEGRDKERTIGQFVCWVQKAADGGRIDRSMARRVVRIEKQFGGAAVLPVSKWGQAVEAVWKGRKGTLFNVLACNNSRVGNTRGSGSRALHDGKEPLQGCGCRRRAPKHGCNPGRPIKIRVPRETEE